MSDDKAEDKGASAPPKGGGTVGKLLGILLPALVAGAASFGGSRAAGAQHAAPAATTAEAARPPGPTLELEPFIFTVPDGTKKTHPIKVTIAVEFEATGKEESLKERVPRVRDASLSYLRTLPYEQLQDATSTEKMRTDMLAAIKASGTSTAQRVLITDLVVQ
jgi:flagellar basal body-associated protein FliL